MLLHKPIFASLTLPQFCVPTAECSCSLPTVECSLWMNTNGRNSIYYFVAYSILLLNYWFAVCLRWKSALHTTTRDVIEKSQQHTKCLNLLFTIHFKWRLITCKRVIWRMLDMFNVSLSWCVRPFWPRESTEQLHFRFTESCSDIRCAYWQRSKHMNWNDSMYCIVWSPVS